MDIARWKRIGLVTAAQGVLYLAFACHVGVREVAAALAAGGLGTIAVLVFTGTGRASIRVRGRDLAQAWRIPAAALTGTAAVMGVLLGYLFLRRRMPSSLRAASFALGSRRSMFDAGRRALALSYPTATPNFIALGFIDRGNLIVYHRIAAGPLPAMVRKLGGRG